MNKKLGKFDMHTHILPEMDDGSPDAEISVKLVNILKNQGVTNIALTPHFYSHRENLESFLKRRNNSYKLLMTDSVTGKAFKNVKFTLASEVYMTESLFDNKDISDLCYAGTDYMLTEIPYNIPFGEDTIDNFKRIIQNYGIHPVIAHIERYPGLFKNIKTIDRLINMGCYTQINLDSLKNWRTAGRIIRLIKNDLVHVVGTDTHSFSKGLDFNSGFHIISKKAGEGFCNKICANSQKIIRNEAL